VQIAGISAKGRWIVDELDCAQSDRCSRWAGNRYLIHDRNPLFKESCLARMILFGEGSIRKANAQFVDHYHRERNHQGLGNRLISPEKVDLTKQGDVARWERLGG
jgi:hypothetical protein